MADKNKKTSFLSDLEDIVGRSKVGLKLENVEFINIIKDAFFKERGGMYIVQPPLRRATSKFR